MNYDYCPLCGSRLEVTEVAPCMECGHRPEEIEHARAGRHTYAEVLLFGENRLILCDFCQVDFGSWRPEAFGLPAHASRVGYEHLTFVRDVPVYIGKDKYCPNCGLRLAFLEFLERVRAVNRKDT